MEVICVLYKTNRFNFDRDQMAGLRPFKPGGNNSNVGASPLVPMIGFYHIPFICNEARDAKH